MNEMQLLPFFSSSEHTLIIDLLEKHLNELVETLSREGSSEAAVSVREQIQRVIVLLEKLRCASKVSGQSVNAPPECKSSA
jgi:hypothetical protein